MPYRPGQIIFERSEYLCKNLRKMIQRVQTIHLLFTVILSILLFFMPLASLTIATSGTEMVDPLEDSSLPMIKEVIYVLDIYSIKRITGITFSKLEDTYWLAGINIIVLIITSVVIFLYKNRPLQANLIRLCFLLVIIFIVLAFYYAQEMQRLTLINANIDYKIADLFPLLQLLFLYLANKGVTKDEALVRSADRIR